MNITLGTHDEPRRRAALERLADETDAVGRNGQPSISEMLSRIADAADENIMAVAGHVQHIYLHERMTRPADVATVYRQIDTRVTTSGYDDRWLFDSAHYIVEYQSRGERFRPSFTSRDRVYEFLAGLGIGADEVTRLMQNTIDTRHTPGPDGSLPITRADYQSMQAYLGGGIMEMVDGKWQTTPAVEYLQKHPLREDLQRAIEYQLAIVEVRLAHRTGSLTIKYQED